MSNLKPPPVHRIIVAQLLASALLAAVFLVFSNAIAAYSALLGGLVSAVPNGYFAVQAFRFRGAQNAEKVVKSFRKGEVVKIMMTILMFAMIFTVVPNVEALALIVGFVAVLFTGIMMSGLIRYSPSGNSQHSASTNRNRVG